MTAMTERGCGERGKLRTICRRVSKRHLVSKQKGGEGGGGCVLLTSSIAARKCPALGGGVYVSLEANHYQNLEETGMGLIFCSYFVIGCGIQC